MLANKVYQNLAVPCSFTARCYFLSTYPANLEALSVQLLTPSIFRFNLSLQFLSSQEKETCEQLMEKLLGSLEVSNIHRIVWHWGVRKRLARDRSVVLADSLTNPNGSGIFCRRRSERAACWRRHWTGAGLCPACWRRHWTGDGLCPA